MLKASPTFMVSFALTALVLTASAHAQHHPAHGGHPGMAQHPAHMQQQMMHQQQQMQQAMLHQQQQMMQQQQKMMRAHQQQMLNQQKPQQQHATSKAAQKKHAAAPATAGPGGTGSAGTGKAAPAQTGVSASASTSGSHTGNHKETKHQEKVHPHVVHHGHPWLSWPHASTAAYRGTMGLKQALDAIAQTPAPTAAQRNTLSKHLMAVGTSPRPAEHQVHRLSNDIANAFATRSLPQVDTETMALQLRALMNGAHLTPGEVEQTIAANRQVLSLSEVPPGQIHTVASALQIIAMHAHARLK
jgi:hypothetical protein